MTKRLLIIPARGNSKRIKLKNIKLFNGKPIIQYSIKNALKSKLFNKIHVSTENNKTIKLLTKLKFDFKRPKQLSGDDVSTLKVLKYVVGEYKKRGEIFDEIWCLSACAPLLSHRDLLKASNLLKKYKNKIIITVSEYAIPIEWAFRKRTNNSLSPLHVGAYKKRSQDIKKSYFDTGDFICMNNNIFSRISNNTKIDKLYHGLVIPKRRAIDIDDIDDWRIAEAYSKVFKN
tara:strand:+ start:443 stop:1135 length:693 start_codon:yes stop_codon:yes gene_type:complete